MIKNILHINSYYSYYGVPGFYKNFFETQLNYGLNISVYVPLDYKYKIVNSVDFGRYTTIAKTHRRVDRYFFHVKQRKILNDILHRFNVCDYNIIHAHSLFTNGYIAYELNKRYGIPYIVAVRNTDLNVFFKKMVHLRGLGNRILQNASKVVFLSHPYKDITISHYVSKSNVNHINDKAIVIPNGIDEFWLNNINSKRDIKITEQINLLFVGRICKRKNPLVTAEACEKLISNGLAVRFTVVGPIDDRSLFMKLKRYHFVDYLGVKKKEELLYVYRDNHIFVMPSLRETFGLVYAEALTQGLPVIYTKGQGFDGQFNEGEVGYSVDSEDSDDIANKVLHIMRDYEELTKKCIELCWKFDWKHITSQYVQIYNDLVC